MQKGRSYSKAVFFMSMSAMLMLFWFLFGYISDIEGRDNEHSLHERGGGADLICIDVLDDLGELERISVMFPHSRHTDTLSKFGYDCTTCHIVDNDGLSSKFKRLTDSDHETVMQTYHVNCIECHRDKRIAGGKVKPTTCGGCHSFKYQGYNPFRETIEFDRHLHYTHVLSSDNKCETCHHEREEEEEDTDESSCRYCHGKNANNKTDSFKEVSHKSCIGCHREKKSVNIKCGPIDCIGCHGSTIKKQKHDDIPRFKLGQPDLIVIKNDLKEVNTKTIYESMGAVPFNHELHEKSGSKCITCHHASLESCGECHTKIGSIEGEYISKVSVMHNKDSKSSCIGCHKSKQDETKCAGCHSSMKYEHKFNNQTCDRCHSLDPSLKLNGSTKNGKNKDHASIEKLLGTHTSKTRLYKPELIPENVTIGSLENEYEAVNFPHRKIVLSLCNQIEDSKLASHFHSDEGTLCQGCHHNSPLSEKPPACASCHNNEMNVSMPYKPRLVGAYHQKCIQCHDAMNLEKLDSRDCNICHTNKNVR